jgi:ribosomal protein S18 acetylase RimI-like enzyme
MAPALRRLLADEHLGLALVAEDDAGLIGYGVATFGYDLEFGGRDAFVTELFVDPRARRRGLGRAMLHATLDALREAGARAAHLMVRPENTRARALYEQAGFAPSPRVQLTRRL